MVSETDAIQPAEGTYTTHQLMKLAELLEQKGITFKRFERIFASGLLSDILEPGADLDNRKGVREALKLGSLPQSNQDIATTTTTIVVDYGLSLEQMIAAGNFDWINSDINSSQFPVQGEGRVECEVRLFNFDESISSKDAEQKISEADPNKPWQAARIEHLLAFATKYPEQQSKHPIVALGSVGSASFFGKRNVPYLYRRVTGRSLHLDWWDNEWHSIYRFLAVRKKT